MTFLKLDDPGSFAGIGLAFANRSRAHGYRVHEAEGSFSVDGRLAPAVARLSLDAPPLDGHASAHDAGRVPRIAIYCGKAIGYPYWAYYAHALLSIGLTYTTLAAEEVAAGRLADFDLLVMPGGFATWGLDRAEGIANVDAAIRDFLAGGGAYIGSCGGAFYMSEGRPGWLGLLDATPRYTQEYLLTGAALLTVTVTDPVLGRGLGEAIELPYYHGPVYTNEDRLARSLGGFRDFVLPSTLFIDNPLDPGHFGRCMRGAPAILAAPDGGRVIVFSPHPEMGEFLRKGIAFESYIRRFRPIRGEKVMDETLRFYMKEDCAGFRLIHNAMDRLGLFTPALVSVHKPMAASAGALSAALMAVDKALEAAFAEAARQAGDETEAIASLLALEFGRLRQEWDMVKAAMAREDASVGVDAGLAAALHPALVDAASSLSATETLSAGERMVLVELPIRLTSAALRIVTCDRALETCE